jgi:hypothetical protein
MTKILGLSGKKQSGKSTTANWIIGQQMCAVDMVSWIRIDQKGRLVVPAVVKGELTEGVFDPLSHQPEAQQLLSQYVWPVVKLYSFADIVKLSALAIFGLEPEQVNGTDEQKNSPTKFRWDQFNDFLLEKTRNEIKAKGVWDDPMTGRHILQVMGTDIFRTIYNDVWVDACIKNIKDDAPELAIVTDCRFPNEIEGIHAAGGKTIRFLRAPFAEGDQHASETALDDYTGFSHVFDNRESTIEQHNRQTNHLLHEWGYDVWEWHTRTDLPEHTPRPKFSEKPQRQRAYTPGFVDTMAYDPLP